MALEEQMTDAQFDDHIRAILRRELNVAEFARYLSLHRVSKGDYTEDRHLWLDKLTLDDIIPDLVRVEPKQNG